MTLTVLCSGQGLQNSRMFSLTGNAPAAQYMFAHAAKLLGGCDPRDVLRTARSEVLYHNRIAQILCVLQALAATAALRDVMPEHLLLAGYSVGEAAAWACAGLIDSKGILDLTALRAELMDAASGPNDGMLSVRGLARPAVDNLCTRYSAAVAIVNPNDVFVLGGAVDALDALAVEATRVGASHVKRIPVNVASHTAKLTDASNAFASALQGTPILSATMDVRLFSGIDGSAVWNLETGKIKLAKQISQRVEWALCLDSCVEAGATAVLELGPGAALSRMFSSVYPNIPSRSLDDFRTIQGVASWVKCWG